MTSVTIFIFVILANMLAAEKLNSKDIIAIKKTWQEIKDEPGGIAKKVCLNLLDKLLPASDKTIHSKPMISMIKDVMKRPEFQSNVNNALDTIDNVIFKDLDRSLATLENMKGLTEAEDLKRYAKVIEVVKSAILDEFSNFMSKEELKAWTRFFSIFEEMSSEE